jgi:hypothetical protein
MLSAVIRWEYSYPALPLLGQLAHQGFPHPSPLVLGTDLLKSRRLSWIESELAYAVLNPARVPL